MSVGREQKIEALRDFLEVNAFAQIDGHSAHDGHGCRGHDEAFTAKAEELLALIDDENYGYGALDGHISPADIEGTPRSLGSSAS